MTKDELLAYLTEGLTDEQRKYVTDALASEPIAKKLTGLRAQKELDEIAAREASLRAELDGGPDKPGAKAYRDWYEKNYAAVVKLQADKTALEAKLAAGPGTGDDKKPDLPAGLSAADISRLVDERIQGGYADRWSNLLTGMGSIVQKHMFAGRKTPIDMKKLSELAASRGGDLDSAYEEYDKPEREATQKAEQEATITRRVNEELQKRGAHANFPAGADATPGILSRERSTEKFDKAAMENDLVHTFMTGQEGGKLTGFGVN